MDAITATTDATAKKVKVSVTLGGKKVVSDIIVKVRKETTKEKNTREVKLVVKNIKALDLTTVAKALNLALDVSSGINDADAYTKAELTTSVDAKIKAHSLHQSDEDTLYTAATTTPKKIGTTAVPASGDMTVDLATAKELTLEVKQGSGNNEHKETVVIFVKAVS